MTTKPKTKSAPAERHVLVTTLHRGVFAGWAADISGTTIFLRDARLCLSWTADLRGFMGLAAFGPSASCTIGPPANITLRDITSVTECSPDATRKWTEFK